jgi:hypothetical protein
MSETMPATLAEAAATAATTYQAIELTSVDLPEMERAASQVLFGVFEARRKTRRPGLVYTEPFALPIAWLAYEGEEGPDLAYRSEQFG